MQSGSETEVRPTLSVVTPSFNSARYLEATLDSVASLSVAHEHLIFDGGSRDGTVELLESRDDPALFWASEPDRGQTHAVNKGLQRARGEFVGWLNADDTYVTEGVEVALELLGSSQGLDAVFGFMDIVDADGRFVKNYRCGRFSWSRYLYFGEYLPTPTMIFRRSLLESVPHLDERYKDAADYDFYLRLLRGARVRNSRRTVVRFRYHSEGKTASNPQLQEREGLEIRLSHARTRLEHGPMRVVNRLMAVRNSLISFWPELPKRS